MTDASRGLSMLPLPELRRLRELVVAQRLSVPLTDGALRATGMGRFAEPLLAVLGGLSIDAICAAIDVAVAERVHRPPPHLRLVWTGPEGQGATARGTEALLSDLFKGARQEVLIAGFRFDHGADIFAPLHRAMVQHGVRTTIFVDINIDKEPKTVRGAEDYAARAVQAFFKGNWPFGDPQPTIYFDPRTALPGPPWVSLHAKCVVVDAKFTFVTSANFTQRAQERNLELGVLIDDADFANKVAEQWWGLVRENKVNRG
jgi:phosphatidylserine/phosphatidylglycerophosphate/cardiolipin synthase-like enzyme